MQKESYFSKKQCITLRNETEWPETLKYRNNILCAPDNKKNMQKILQFVYKKQHIIKLNNVFGNGNSAKKIIKIINKLK